MKFNNIKQKIVSVAFLAFCSVQLMAQDVHFTQFNAAPMIINPAFTGNFNGMYRANLIYRNQWSSVTTPFVTYSASFDGPLKRDLSHADYLAAGVNLYNDRSGDGNLTNMSALATIAYHKFFGPDDLEDKSLSVGLQAGYTQKSIDLSRLYWSDEFKNGGFQPGITMEQLNPKTKYFTTAVGLSWGHSVSEKVSYQVGFAGHNLNQPRESLLKKQNNEVGLGMRLNAQAGAVILVSDRFSINPAVLFQSQTAATELIAGSEFNYILGSADFRPIATGIFIGGWYRNTDAALITAGFTTKGFRFGLGYDYNISKLKVASGGNGGFELSLTYVKPNPLDLFGRKNFPCTRF